jgi:hypothetical protein
MVRTNINANQLIRREYSFHLAAACTGIDQRGNLTVRLCATRATGVADAKHNRSCDQSSSEMVEQSHRSRHRMALLDISNISASLSRTQMMRADISNIRGSTERFVSIIYLTVFCPRSFNVTGGK